MPAVTLSTKNARLGSSESRWIWIACQALRSDARLIAEGAVLRWVTTARTRITTTTTSAIHLTSLAPRRASMRPVWPRTTSTASRSSTRSATTKVTRASIPSTRHQPRATFSTRITARSPYATMYQRSRTMWDLNRDVNAAGSAPDPPPATACQPSRLCPVNTAGPNSTLNDQLRPSESSTRADWMFSAVSTTPRARFTETSRPVR